MQALVPLIPDEDAVVQIAIEESVMAAVDQPLMDLVGQREMLASEANEDDSHRSSRRSAPCQAQGREVATRGQRQEL